jgi:hypothetical protein
MMTFFKNKKPRLWAEAMLKNVIRTTMRILNFSHEDFVFTGHKHYNSAVVVKHPYESPPDIHIPYYAQKGKSNSSDKESKMSMPVPFSPLAKEGRKGVRDIRSTLLLGGLYDSYMREARTA